jgi:predicted transcriptional regulator
MHLLKKLSGMGRLLLGAIVFTSFAMASHVASAADVDTLINKLVDKGVLTRSEAEALYLCRS